MGRLLMQAFGLAGYEVELASRFQSRDGIGNPVRQERLRTIGGLVASRVLARNRGLAGLDRPMAWLTYHLYYKAPDWLGPQVASALSIPYVVAEASVAHRRAGGPWDLGHRATLAALHQAKAVINLTAADSAGLPRHPRTYRLLPFLDDRAYCASLARRRRYRTSLAAALRLDPEVPWVLAVAMMRRGDKLASYHLLATSLTRLSNIDWRLLIAGDGPARAEVESAVAPLGTERVRFLGQLDDGELRRTYAASDLLAWPAVNEAYGMALLEAQASGLPVVAGCSGGVPDVVRNGKTGLLTKPGDVRSFSQALSDLLIDGQRRVQMGTAARTTVAREHSLEVAADRLSLIMQDLSVPA